MVDGGENLKFELKLKVGELTERGDFGRGIVRISAKDMKKINCNEGDIIEIEEKRKTAAIVVRAYPADIGLDIIRMDGLVRKNCGAGISEVVRVRKADVKEAKFVRIAPARKGIVIHMAGDLLKRNLLMRPAMTGDIIIPNPVVQPRREDVFDKFFFGIETSDFFFTAFGEEKFVVVSTEPKGVTRITRATEVELLPQATEIAEEKVPDVTYEDLGGLHEEIKMVREMIELPLKHPELFESLGIEPPKGILLHGPPGTGKTLLAKAVANESGASFFLINGPEIMSKFYGESEENLRKKFDEAEKNAPSIIFIDEIDAIAPKREEVRGEVEKRVVSQLLTLLDGLKSRGKIIVIGATNIPNAIDPALRRPGRLDREIEIGVPTKEGRKEILQIHTRGMPIEPNYDVDRTRVIINEKIKNLETEIASLTNLKLIDDSTKEEIKNKKNEKDRLNKILQKIHEMSQNEFLKMMKDKQFSSGDDDKSKIGAILFDDMIDKIASITYGYVGADISALCKEAAMHTLRRVLPDIGQIKKDSALPPDIRKNLIVTMDDFNHALKMVEPSAMREIMIEVPNVKWSDIGGLEMVKESLKEAIEWPLKTPEAFTRLGIRPPRGIMLYGPPGCGKTLLAKAIANESDANFIYTKASDLLSMWVGESEKHVRDTFRRAKQVAPSIIFFDEIDSLVPRRGSAQDSHVTERVVSQLLAEISGLEELHGVVVVAATNRPDIIDPALLRPGRFDRQILVPTPDEKARLEVLKIHTKGMPLMGVDLDMLAKTTEGFSGADLEALCREAAMNALRKDMKADKITKRDFDKALKEVKPSVGEDMNKFYESIVARKKREKIEEEVSYTG